MGVDSLIFSTDVGSIYDYADLSINVTSGHDPAYFLAIVKGLDIVDFPNVTNAKFAGATALPNTPSVVPIPAAVWLFASGIGVLGWFGRKQSFGRTPRLAAA